jgi:hypothetical protein
MKTIIFAFSFVIGGLAFGQDVQYKITKDDPMDVNNFYVNLDLLQTEFPLNNIAGTSFAIGISPYACYHNKFGAEATFRRGWLNLFGPPRVNFELGGFFNLTQKTITRNQKVILDIDEWTSGSTKYTETKFIRVPAQNMRSLGVRGGFLTNRETYKPEDHPTLTGTYDYRWTGVYAGIQLTSQMNLRMNTDNFGEAGAGFIRRYYADVTIHPMASLRDAGTDNKVNTSIGRIGFRCGLIAMPAERRKMQAPIYIKTELGFRPLDGAFMNVSFGINFKRKLNKLGVNEVKRETE